MTPELAISLLRDALTVVITVAGPLLLTALTVGVVVSLLQAVTQVQEQSLTFLPKLAAVGLMFMLMLPWILRGLTEFIARSLQALPGIAR
jgi:flagellar biosynthetic protein FliQ